MDIHKLNEKYKVLNPEERLNTLYKDFDKILVTSSFGTTSAYLLHLINKVKKAEIIHFIDTTNHFKETLAYKDDLVKMMILNLLVLKGEKWKNEYTHEFKVWEKDPDICCSINKVEPVDKIKDRYQVWISGLMSWQSSRRSSLDIFEQKGAILKFYPLIDVPEEEVWDYYEKHKLPHHPLKAKGYESVGCDKCTIKGKRREGRWTNFFKNECGLHI